MSVSAPRRRVALYGGTFDPPHVAHVLAVAAVLSITDVDAVWVLPVYRHPLAKQPTPWADRLALCERAFDLFGDRVQLRTDEAELGGGGRTLDLILHLRARHPATDFRLMIGTDQLSERHRWHRFDEVCRLAPPIVLDRPGHPAPARYRPIVALPDLSSTAARAALRSGEVPTWLPTGVRRHIVAAGLYGVGAARHRSADDPADTAASAGTAPRLSDSRALLPALTIIGAGRAGTTLALALAGRPGAVPVHLICRDSTRRAALAPWAVGLPLHVAASPTPAMCACRVVVFATADRQLRAAAEMWQAAITRPPRQSMGDAVWLHLSGVAPPDVLRVPGHVAAVGSCHPLAAIPDPLALAQPSAVMADARRVAAKPLRGAFFALAGDRAAVVVGRALAQAVGGAPHEVPVAQRAAYHGAASVVANDLVALLAIGERLCGAAALPASAIRPALLHLARTALDAVATAASRPGAQLADGLSGAVGRGDADTLSQHLDALSSAPDQAEAHRRLSRVLLALVVSGDRLAPDRAEAVRRALA